MGLDANQLLIAEVKTKSPFGWRAEEPWSQRFKIADEHGDWVAVHTHEYWGGSFRLLEKARRQTEKPLLAKGIHASDKLIQRALDAGADHVLTVGYIPGPHLTEHCLVEPLTVFDLKSVSDGIRTVWNARNPLTGEDRADGFDEARGVRPEGWLCQASNIITIEDVHPAADAILVGTHLPEFVKSL